MNARLRPALLLPALLLSSLTWAGIWVDHPAKLFERLGGLPKLSQGARPVLQSGVRPAPRPEAPRERGLTAVSGRIYALHTVSVDGQETELPEAAGLDLGDALPIEADAVELLLELDGPVWVYGSLSGGGQGWTELQPETLRVVLEDPDAAAEAAQVRLTLDAGWQGPLEDALRAVAE